MANDGTTLRVALGDYPHTLPLKRGEITSPWLKLEFVEAKPLYQAFKPMVREHAFDASEMALVTCESSVIGRSVALALWRAGADVIVNWVNGEKAALAVVQDGT